MTAYMNGGNNPNKNQPVLDFELDNLLADKDSSIPEAKSIRNIAIILSCISNGINTAGEIAAYTTVSRSTVHRILRGLERSLLVVQDPVTRKYYHGALVRRIITKPLVTHEYLVHLAEPEMQRLGGITGETIILCVKIGLYHAFLHSIPSSHEFRIAEQSRRMGPLYKGAGGKVLLAQLSDHELKEVIKHIEFEFTTPSQKDELLEEIKNIRRRGYAITANERIQLSTFIAAPIQGYEVPAEVSIIGLSAQIEPYKDVYVERLLETTDRISRILLESKKQHLTRL